MSDWAPLLAFFGSLLGCAAWLRIARRAQLDVPGQRSLHVIPTPTSGGIGILAGLLPAMAWLHSDGLLEAGWCLALLLACGLSVVGFLDDRRGLPVRWRLLAQLLASVLFLAALWPEIGESTLKGSMLGLGVLLWLVAFTNLYNFMDGIDGFAAVQALFAAGAAALLVDAHSTALVLAVVSAASLGFLAWNWPPARLFMGDTGSLLLGFLFASGAVLGVLRAELSAVVWTILWAPFLVDGGLTLAHRALRGVTLTRAHREHAYQRHALQAGSHRPVTVALLALDIGWLLPLAFLACRYPEAERLLLMLAVLPLVLIFFRSPGPRTPD